MKKSIFLSFFSFFVSFSSAQNLTSADTAYILEQIRFPELNFDLVVRYNAATFMVDQPMPKNLPLSLDTLRARLQVDSTDENTLLQLFYYYRELNQIQAGMPYLDKALQISLKAFEVDRGNLDKAQFLASVLMDIQRPDAAVKVWDEYTKIHQDSVDGWWQKAMAHLHMMQFAEAKHCLEKGYKSQPRSLDLYVSEVAHQIYTALHLASDTAQVFSFNFDRSFFEKAMKEHPDLRTPKMALALLDLIGVFFETVIAQAAEMDKDKPLKLKLSADNKKLLKELETYFLSLSQQKLKNPYYVYKSMLLVSILQNNSANVAAYFKKATDLYNGDPEMFKIITFYYILERQWDKAATHFEQFLQVKSGTATANEYMDMAKIYYENKDYTKCIGLLTGLNLQYDLITEGDFRAAYGILAAMVKQGQWYQSIDMLDALAQIRTDAANEPNYGYYWACFQILLGKPEAAKAALQAISQEPKHDFYESAKELLKRYVK